MPEPMSRLDLARYVTPWKFRREQEEQQRVQALRERDGDTCRRCRRPIRFDVPAGHDKAPVVQHVLPPADGEAAMLDNLCLTHARCNAAGADNTVEVADRIRRRNEAELLPASRKRAGRRA